MNHDQELHEVTTAIGELLDGKPGSFAAEALVMCLAGFILATVSPSDRSKAIVVAMKALREMVKTGEKSMREHLQ